MFILSGCGRYWQVIDPTTKNIYYTEEVKESKSSGAVRFIEAKPGKEVTLQNSEVKEISADEFKAGIRKK